jgi:hypothetical protein
MLNLETLHGRPARHSHQWPQPDTQKIARWMRTYLRVVAVQGTMQVAIIVVMARFATGF